MATIRLTGHVDENGRLEVDQPDELPPGDVMITIELISSEDEAADEARWAASFAKSQDMLARMAEKALQNLEAGLADDLDPDTL